MSPVIATAQGITKDCVVGDRLMDRYAVFNGLERVRRITRNLTVEICGVRAASAPTGFAQIADPDPPGLAAGHYAWVAVYASATALRPVPVADGSGSYTRGNPSSAVCREITIANAQVTVTVPCIQQDGITHVLLYRSLRAAHDADALNGPFYYVARGLNSQVAGASVDIVDSVNDDAVGFAVETNNFPPSAYRYAVAARGYIFMGGGYFIGSIGTCTVTPGSALVTIAGEPLFDGISGWRFKVLTDTENGVDEGGSYFADYVDGTTIRLTDENGDEFAYNGAAAASGLSFALYLPSNVLRWSKNGEPEAVPATNLIQFEGDITGLAQLPNQPVLLVCTDTPSMYTLDLNQIGTAAFLTNRMLISTEHTTYSHWSLTPVEGRLRGIDSARKCIIETDGTIVDDITGNTVPHIFDYLDQDMQRIRLWHCAYDQSQHLFGAFCTFTQGHRMVDFCIGQYLISGGWFFNFEKDLLCTGLYIHPTTGETLVLGGTEGPGDGRGGVWGRIWTPDVYSEWIPSGTLLSGTISRVIDATTFEVDNSSLDLWSSYGGLAGRWVLVCNPQGEYAQVGYIDTNTENRITVQSVINSVNPTQFSPVPEAGWQFYLGLIEMRWGPKLFDFGDPDLLKHVLELWCTVSGHDEENLPFFRLYRGFEEGYSEQLTFTETRYLDQTQNQSLVNKVNNKLEPVPRWGVAWYDRSYRPTMLRSATIVFHAIMPIGGGPQRMGE